MMYLVIAAILPIIGLCTFVYKKDKNKEPKGLLTGIFLLGFVTVFPVLICELVFGAFFPMNKNGGFIHIFFNVLFGVAMYEEGFKWLVTKFLGYNNKEFDEVYDIIVYAVFSSLGFACFENICYVLQNGFGNAILRALLAVPGHTCFAISMGYFFSKAKVNQITGNHSLYSRNMVFSIVVPIILHTFYDALLFSVGSVGNYGELFIKLIPFLIFYISMIIVCFLTVDKTAKVQHNISFNLLQGTIARNQQGFLYYNYNGTQPAVPVTAPPTPVPVTTPITTPPAQFNNNPMVQAQITPVFADNPVSVPQPVEILEETLSIPQPTVVEQQPALQFCPICGKPSNGKNFCSKCGFRFK